MFKKLVNIIVSAENFDDAFCPVDAAFQKDKITWKEHQILFKLCERIFD